MTNKKMKISEEMKQSIKDAVEMKSGAVDMASIRILPSGSHTKADYQEIVDVIRGGKAWILPVTANRNTSYNLRKALADPTAEWNTETDPKDPKKTVPRKYAIKKVLYGDVLLNEDGKSKPTKNIALYLA